MSELRIVFFDLDGTLLDNTAAFPQVFVDVLGVHGMETSLARLESALNECWPWYEARVGSHRDDEMSFWRAFNSRVCAAVGAGERSELIGGAITEHFVALDAPRLFDDVLPCLDSLDQADYRLGVITARPDARRVLEPLGLVERFELLVDAFSAGSAKQDARAFEYALEQAAVSAQNAVHIGDQYQRDVVPAQDAGIRAVLLDRAERYPDVDCSRVSDLYQFMDFLDRL